MKRILIIIAAFGIFSFSANAQVERKQVTGHPQVRGMQPGMMKDLNLTDAQKEQIKQINMDFMNKMRDLKKNGNMTMNDFNTQKAALAKDRKDKVMAILTDEQRAKMESMKKDKEERMKDMQEKHLQKMQTELNLTSDQVAKLKAKNEEMQQKMTDLRNNTTMSQDQKKAQMQNLQQERKAFMESLLTVDQKKKLEEMKSKRTGAPDKKPLKNP